ncbi:hypothetical protein ACE6H2_014418 [Prunus campanulata]
MSATIPLPDSCTKTRIEDCTAPTLLLGSENVERNKDSSVKRINPSSKGLTGSVCKTWEDLYVCELVHLPLRRRFVSLMQSPGKTVEHSDALVNCLLTRCCVHIYGWRFYREFV